MKNERPTRFTIGIQARSGSSRLPHKVDRIIGNHTVLRHVLDSCLKAAIYQNRLTHLRNIDVRVAICTPVGDPIAEAYKYDTDIIEGPEDDVLTRYIMLMERCNSDYVVRITSDCPLIPHSIISKHITVALMNEYDYVSNVDEKCRTSPDGYDCEVISKKLLLECHEKAIDKKDREHVTTWIRRERPQWAKFGFVINEMDCSDKKLSLDNEEDEKNIKKEFEKKEEKRKKAEALYGKKNVHSFS